MARCLPLGFRGSISASGPSSTNSLPAWDSGSGRTFAGSTSFTSMLSSRSPPTIAAMVTRHLGVPYVLRPLGTLSSYGVTRRRPWMKRLSIACVEGPALRHAAAVHFTSPSEEQEARLLGIEMKGVVIPLGIEGIQGGKRDSLFSDLGIPRSGPTIVSLSRIDPVKNLEGLLRALAILRHEGHSPTLLVGGAGASDYVESLRELARREGVGDQVHWLGQVGGQVKADLLAAADVFVLPSFSENFGLAAVEALAAGLPCVLGCGVALAEEVGRAGAGVVVDPNPESIAGGTAAFPGRSRRAKGRGRRCRRPVPAGLLAGADGRAPGVPLPVHRSTRGPGGRYDAPGGP